MGTAGPPRATVFNESGVGARKLEAAGWLTAVLLFIGIFVGIYLSARDQNAIASLSVQIVAVVVVGFLCWVNAIGGKADDSGRPAAEAPGDPFAGDDAGDPLAGLPKGHFILNDFVSTKGEIDHIVVSPKGILIVENRRRTGAVAPDGRIFREGPSVERDSVEQAWAQAHCIRDQLVRFGISVPMPQPVILITDADLRVREKAKGVDILGRRYFPEYVERLQNRMKAKDAKKVFELLKISNARMFV